MCCTFGPITLSLVCLSAMMAVVVVVMMALSQALFLLAPFTGVGDMAESIVGGTLASMFNLNQWDNKVCIRYQCNLVVGEGMRVELMEVIYYFRDLRAKFRASTHARRVPPAQYFDEIETRWQAILNAPPSAVFKRVDNFDT